PSNKWKIIDETRALVKDFEQQYQDGLITQGEKYNKAVDAWGKCSQRLADEMTANTGYMKKAAKGRDRKRNSIYTRAEVRARGLRVQMRQLAAMRNLM